MASRRFSALLLGLSALATAGGLTLAGTGLDTEQGQSPAAHAVRALTTSDGAGALAAVPEDFAAVRGYEPVLEDGHLVRADGDCSSPVSLPEEFEPACRQHDYGYDLLRYAEQTGEPLGRWARGAVDEAFADRLHELCDEGPSGATCRQLGFLAVTGVEFNSVRQGDGVPEESVLTNAALATSAVGLLGMSGAAIPRGRGRRR
ncbi:hypothetical protein NF556_01090 [Ornithinimicrobium faecis]|uniref:Phospholipase A2 n=1 Tax=Ornithinimicrobium faecis TaxID=2934158 RepID=A0ABY4YU77_9MICO|nr:hypothetical protein [Ornithinimicrobium sp. HY1793]USQ80288.1 hypothetical protein NF556_01090 [Ornithinimicrobium sp. HY1793]